MITLIHTHENNPVSQSILDSDKTRLSKQVKLVLDLLIKGNHLTVYDATVTYKVTSLPRRILDIEERLGIRAERIHNGVTTYYFSEQQKQIAKEKIKND